MQIVPSMYDPRQGLSNVEEDVVGDRGLEKVVGVLLGTGVETDGVGDFEMLDCSECVRIGLVD